MSGYSEQELRDVQQRWRLRFPPDLLDVYRTRRSVIPGDTFDWVRSSKAEIQQKLDWPMEGLLFDLNENALWLEEWGPKPKKRSAAEAILREAVLQAPRLIPIYGHRYIAEMPAKAGNPVFSVYQSDIIIYGANLTHYIAHELKQHAEAMPSARRITFWTELVERNGGE